MIVKLLTEHHLEFLSLTGGWRVPSESTLVKMSNFWKSHAAAHLFASLFRFLLKEHKGGVTVREMYHTSRPALKKQ